MASTDDKHTDAVDATYESLTLSPETGRKLGGLFAVTALVGLVAAVVLAFLFGGFGGGGLRRLFLSYLVAYCFALTIALGALFFVMLQHITRAGWSVNVRRVPEALAMTMPVLAVLAVPILLSFLITGTSGHPTLYPWATPAVAEEHEGEEGAGAKVLDSGEDIHTQSQGPAPEHGEGVETAVRNADVTGEIEPTAAQVRGELVAQGVAPAGVTQDPLLTKQALTVGFAREHLENPAGGLTDGKRNYLNRPFFLLRLVLYFGVWIGLATFFWRNSVEQDRTGDPKLTRKMEVAAPLCILAYALTLTFGAFDLIMSVDPHFFSTIFGGYIFAGGMVGFFATCILIYQFLRMNGMLKESVTVEHYHDLGKWLFAFVFFWGYVAFSQFMLIWYANVPETTYWFGVRGASSVGANHSFAAWPSAGLTGADLTAANLLPAPVGWWTIISMTLLFGHLLIPFAGLLSRHVKRNLTFLGFWAGWMLTMHFIDVYWLIAPENMVGGWQVLPLPELACVVLVVGVVGAYFVRTLTAAKLRPARDPRLVESMAFHNM